MRTISILAFCLLGAGAAHGDNLIVSGWIKGGAANSSSVAPETIQIGQGAWCGGWTSQAFGYNAHVYSHYSTAFGMGTEVKCYNTFVLGRYNISDGYDLDSYVSTDPAFVIGNGTSATARSDAFKILKNGDTSIFGCLEVGSPNSISISGKSSIGLGTDLTVSGAYQTVLGRFNVLATYNATTWTAADPLLVVANGDSDTQRSNALVVLKNGNTGIGTSTPTYKLDVDGGVRVKNGAVLVQPQGDLSMGTYTSGPQP